MLSWAQAGYVIMSILSIYHNDSLSQQHPDLNARSTAPIHEAIDATSPPTHTCSGVVLLISQLPGEHFDGRNTTTREIWWICGVNMFLSCFWTPREPSGYGLQALSSQHKQHQTASTPTQHTYSAILANICGAASFDMARWTAIDVIDCQQH